MLPPAIISNHRCLRGVTRHNVNITLLYERYSHFLVICTDCGTFAREFHRVITVKAIFFFFLLIPLQTMPVRAQVPTPACPESNGSVCGQGSLYRSDANDRPQFLPNYDLNNRLPPGQCYPGHHLTGAGCIPNSYK